MKKGRGSIEDILGSRAKIALLRFLSLNRDWQFNLSKISSGIGMDKGALSRIIKELEALDALEVKRSGKLLLFRLNSDDKLISELIVPFFEKEEKMK